MGESGYSLFEGTIQVFTEENHEICQDDCRPGFEVGMYQM
jgi:hypothetical protein